MSIRALFPVSATVLFGISGTANVAADKGRQDQEIVHFGTMHEAIWQKQHQGRIRSSELLECQNFYGTAALEQLQGEVTIQNGEITITTVNADGKLASAAGSLSDKQATMRVGPYVPSWSKQTADRDVEAGDFDTYIADAAGVSAPGFLGSGFAVSIGHGTTRDQTFHAFGNG